MHCDCLVVGGCVQRFRGLENILVVLVLGGLQFGQIRGTICSGRGSGRDYGFRDRLDIGLDRRRTDWRIRGCSVDRLARDNRGGLMTDRLRRGGNYLWLLWLL